MQTDSFSFRGSSEVLPSIFDEKFLSQNPDKFLCQKFVGVPLAHECKSETVPLKRFYKVLSC